MATRQADRLGTTKARESRDQRRKSLDRFVACGSVIFVSSKDRPLMARVSIGIGLETRFALFAVEVVLDSLVRGAPGSLPGADPVSADRIHAGGAFLVGL